MFDLIPFSILGIVLGIVLVILNIILFFKVWGMTNNTKKIRAFLEATRPDLEWHGDYEFYMEKKEEK